MQLFWFIPTHGEGRYLGTHIGGRAITLGYMRQIAQAVDELGYAGALLPTGRSCEDAWVVASSLMPATKRMKFLVAMRPGLVSPTLAARMAATFDRLSDGRLLINVVTGGDPVELAADGVHLSHDDRYVVTDEFLTIWRQIMAGESVTYVGEHLRVEDAKILLPSVQRPYPPLYFGGSSPAAQVVAAKHVDVYLTWGEPPALVAQKIAEMREKAAAVGRTLHFGIRLHMIVRPTEAEAWRAADEMLKYLDDKTIAAAQRTLAHHDSHGQQRMLALHQGRRDKLIVSPNLWAGVGLVRGGAGTALVGDPESVAARMLEYAELGIETFILSGYPHLEEAYNVAELLFPLLPLDTESDQSTTATAPAQQLLGEIIANNYLPTRA